MTLRVSVKWNKQKFDNVPLNTAEPPLAFKKHLQSLTRVAPDRQKIMVKGGLLKDDADWSTIGVKEGHLFMLMGTPDEPEEVVVMEDAPAEEEKAEEPTVERPNVSGLVNLGNTCYMNATLQTLRCIPELSNAVKGLTISLADSNPETSLALGFRSLLQQMEHSEKVEPGIFVQALRTAFPQFAQQAPNGSFMQQDAEECWTQLVSALARKLPGGAIQKLFHGELQTELSCSDAPEEPKQVNAETFQKLTCHISDQTSHLLFGLKKSLEEAISKNSPSLGREAQYQRISRLSKLPLYLPIQFVRFFWKQAKTETGSKQQALKILRPVTFPARLDVYDLCSDSLKAKLEPKRTQIREEEEARLKLKKTGEKAEEGSKTAGESSSGTSTEITENDSGLYDLMGVITHKGRAADGGHYVAWVRHAPNLWLKYDDDTVTSVREDEVLALDGKKGGDWHLAYMCVYASRGLLK